MGYENNIIEARAAGYVFASKYNSFKKNGLFRKDRAIYVACDESGPIFDRVIANRASSRIGDDYNYNLLRRNCNNFVAECINGEYKKNTSTLKGVIGVIKNNLCIKGDVFLKPLIM